MALIKQNDHVFLTDDSFTRINRKDIEFLKKQSKLTRRKRARICAHRENDDIVQEMIIAFHSDSYIHPHKHVNKTESFHILEGTVDIIIFDDEGEIRDVIKLGEPKSSRAFFYRLTNNMFHTLLIKTEYLVLHEVTTGPFDRSRTILADFAPDEDNAKEVSEYTSKLKSLIR